MELLQSLEKRDETKNTKVLVISAHLDDEVKAKLEELHVDGMIAKPVNNNELKKYCDLLLGKKGN